MLWLNVLRSNFSKIFIEMKRYLPDTISLIVTMYAIFLAMFFGITSIGNPETMDVNIQYGIVITVMWFLAIMAMQGVGYEINSEATRGTLEQLYMSPVPAWFILFSRMLAAILMNLVIYAIVLVAIMATSRQWLNFDFITLIPLFVFMTFCMIGVGFMIAGLALLFKQISSFLQIAQFAYFGLVAVPIGLSPFLEFLPIVRVASMVRESMIDGLTLTDFSGMDWTVLAVNSAIYFIVGVAVYKLAEARAMQRGLLGKY